MLTASSTSCTSEVGLLKTLSDWSESQEDFAQFLQQLGCELDSSRDESKEVEYLCFYKTTSSTSEPVNRERERWVVFFLTSIISVPKVPVQNGCGNSSSG